MSFDLTGFGAAFGLVGKVIDKIFPDKESADKAKLELLKMQQAGEFKELEAELQKAQMQVNINVEEAKSLSNFRGGWRPFVGWVCGLGLLYSVLLQPLITALIQTFVPGYAQYKMPNVETEVLMTLLLGMLGLGGYRTFERVVKK